MAKNSDVNDIEVDDSAAENTGPENIEADDAEADNLAVLGAVDNVSPWLAGLGNSHGLTLSTALSRNRSFLGRQNSLGPYCLTALTTWPIIEALDVLL